MVQDYDERIANLEAERDAALVRAERAEAERDALRAQIDAEGWRPVDGLQEADRTYLVWNGIEMETAFWIDKTSYRGGLWGNGHGLAWKASHYRPLPPPPAEEE